MSESVQGLVERVTYHNEETGFCVLRIHDKNRRDLTTVVGHIASVSAGEWLIAEGHWVRDRDHGLQLKAVRMQSSPPTSLEGIEKYLGSGMVKGIGPVYAKKMVEKFGDKIFDIIDNQSAKLEDIDGIGPGRRKKIKEAWAEQKVIREIMVFLHSNGISTSRAVRIYKTYGEHAIEKVRDNPYILVRDIHGIGFKTADKMARSMGIPFDSVLRARAGLMHVLSEASSHGHCGLPLPELMVESEKLLEVPPARIQEAIEKSLQSYELIRESISKDLENLIMLPVLHQCELQIYDCLNRLIKAHPTLPSIRVDKAIDWCQEKTGRELAAHQKLAIEVALSSRVVVITGGPGVGKTTLIQSLLMILNAKKVRTLLCAPTGRAAKRMEETSGMEARTIHRLLEGRIGGFNRHQNNPLECDVLVVDECSMIDVTLMAALLKALPASAHIVFVGDVDQLPSVGPGSVLKDFIECDRIPVVKLTQVFRQAAESRIITIAHEINQGLTGDLECAESDNDFFFIQRDEPEKAADTLVNLVARKIPQKLNLDPIRHIQVLCPMNRGSLGVRELNLRLQLTLNPPRDGQPTIEKFGCLFRPGDKVIQTQNNYDKEVFNGDIGIIQEIDADDQIVVIQFDDRIVDYEFNELDEITLAYAITIHKSQGSEFPVVVMPVAMQQFIMLQRNLLYTGVTRGKSMVVIVGQSKAFQYAVQNSESARRYSALKARLQRAG
ncbi:MAG: ATP-dependent RecD-like DNA helicase [Verrucomicrobia bacterium]|nr:ATP-dependent RecD-like DNA helicase [Verrucomicrobiota bacterium]